MVRAWLAAVLITMVPTAGFAQACGTVDLIDTVTAEERERLDTLVSAHPFAEGTAFRATKGENEVIVIGTLHTPDPRFAPVVERLRPHVEAADLLVLETTSDAMNDMQSMVTTRPEMFFLTEGPTMIDLLTEEEWALVSEQLSEIGIPAFFAAKFQPWYLSMTLAVPPCAMSMLVNGEKGLDFKIEEIAKAEALEIESLDDLDALMEMMAGGTVDEQLAEFRVMLRAQQDATASYSTLTEAYFDGRIREGWEFVRIQIDRMDLPDGEAMFDKIEQALLIDRNRKWEARLPEMIDGKDTIIAVGAAHLSGESGVVRALERAGYEISRF